MSESNEKSFDADSVESKYIFCKELGRGANGIVREGSDRVTSEKVAIKTSVAHGRFSYSVGKECFIYKVLHGITGIPRLISYGRDYFALEKLGDSLHSILLKRRYVPLELRSILLIVDQLLSCIEAMHSRDVFHQDLKTTNVLMGLGSKSNIVNVIDFGSAIYGPTETVKFFWKKIDITQVGHLIVDLFQGVSTFRRFSEMREEIKTYLEYCKTLKSEHEIDYKYLKQIFKKTFELNGYKGTVIFE